MRGRVGVDGTAFEVKRCSCEDCADYAGYETQDADLGFKILRELEEDKLELPKWVSNT